MLMLTVYISNDLPKTSYFIVCADAADGCITSVYPTVGQAFAAYYEGRTIRALLQSLYLTEHRFTCLGSYSSYEDFCTHCPELLI